MVDNVKHNNWRLTKDNALEKVDVLPALQTEKARQFTPKTRPPLVKNVTAKTPHRINAAGEAFPPGEGLTKTSPRPYQVELFRAVTACERNSLVWLPMGLDNTLIASMVLQQILELNPERQGFFLVETTALAMQQVWRSAPQLSL